MRKALLAGLKPAEKFLFTVVILFILGLFFQFLGAFLAAWIYGFGISEIFSLGTFNDPQYIAASKLIQILGSIGTFIIPAFLFSYLLFILTPLSTSSIPVNRSNDDIGHSVYQLYG